MIYGSNYNEKARSPHIPFRVIITRIKSLNIKSWGKLNHQNFQRPFRAKKNLHWLGLFKLCSDNERKLENHDKKRHRLRSLPSQNRILFVRDKFIQAPLRSVFLLLDKCEQLKTLLCLKK